VPFCQGLPGSISAEPIPDASIVGPEQLAAPRWCWPWSP